MKCHIPEVNKYLRSNPSTVTRKLLLLVISAGLCSHALSQTIETQEVYALENLEYSLSDKSILHYYPCANEGKIVSLLQKEGDEISIATVWMDKHNLILDTLNNFGSIYSYAPSGRDFAVSDGQKIYELGYDGSAKVVTERGQNAGKNQLLAAFINNSRVFVEYEYNKKNTSRWFVQADSLSKQALILEDLFQGRGKPDEFEYPYDFASNYERFFVVDKYLVINSVNHDRIYLFDSQSQEVKTIDLKSIIPIAHRKINFLHDYATGYSYLVAWDKNQSTELYRFTMDVPEKADKVKTLAVFPYWIFQNKIYYTKKHPDKSIEIYAQPLFGNVQKTLIKD